jgi:ferritin
MRISDQLYSMFERQYCTEAGNFLVFQNIANLAGNSSWKGLENLFKEYALDEITHAQKIADFITDRNRVAVVDTLPNPNIGQSDSPIDWVHMAYSKAQGYTALINQIYEECLKEGDHEAAVFLNWYLGEQRCVESFFYDLGLEIARAGSDAALLAIDARYLPKP